MKNVGVPFTPLRIPPVKSARTRALRFPLSMLDASRSKIVRVLRRGLSTMFRLDAPDFHTVYRASARTCLESRQTQLLQRQLRRENASGSKGSCETQTGVLFRTASEFALRRDRPGRNTDIRNRRSPPK